MTTTGNPRSKAALLGGIAALTLGLGLGANALYSATHDDPPPSDDEVVAELMDNFMEQAEERMAKAGYDSYYRRLAEMNDLPRAEMDEVLEAAPRICYYFWTVDNTEAAKDVARPFVADYPSDFVRDIQSGKLPNGVGYTARDMLDIDALAWVIDTALDYCPTLGYGY